MTVQPTRDQLRALADRASRGPWIANNGYVSAAEGRDGIAGNCTDVDAEFIAAARNALPALLDALDQAEAERDAARGYVSELETAVQSRNDVIKHRDTRIKAVRDVLDRHAHYGLVEADDIRRALEG